MYLMRNKGRETLIDVCPQGGMEGGHVARQLLVDACHKWWMTCGAMCVFLDTVVHYG